ncbi:MAG TPA: iron-containing redox enzyme family protein [Burkholderiales bacterium]|nr:iron-containing redox enzyme family protein [Burkholderiales bacterium]
MGSARVLSPQPQWVDSLHGYVKPYWDELLQGEWAEGVACTRLSISEMRGWILQIYPFIHAFPKFLAEALIKVEDDDSRSFLIDNIRVEKAHAEHWIWMGMGFGLKKQDMLDLAEGNRPVLRDVQSLTDWLWFINTKGSLAEAVGATSFAIEGVAGDIARKVTAGFEAYRGQPGVEMGPKTYKWFREHAHYDDEHPKIALEIVKRYATTEKMQTRVMLAAKRSIQLLHNALLTGYQAYTPAQASGESIDIDKREADRRAQQLRLAFPDRRFRERRGLNARKVA